MRIEYPGAFYHVTSRGNAKHNIYLTDEDRVTFLEVLADVVETHNLRCHAYCLMNNHYHLLLETPDANLSNSIRDLNGMYAQIFNQLHKRVGHIFQGRFKAFLIEQETYLREVARYIVLNPVRAKITSNPRAWKWSSYKSTAGETAIPTWLYTDQILGMFSKRRKVAQQEYKKFVHAGIKSESPFLEIGKGGILGTPQFIFKVWDKTPSAEDIKEIPKPERIIGRPSLEELFHKINSINERNAAIRLARKRCRYSVTEIASFLRLDRSTVGKISRELP